MTIQRYVSLIAGFTILILMFIAGFNYLINPYLIFDSPRIDGVNAIKADISN